MHLFKDKKAGEPVSETELEEEQSGKAVTTVILFIAFVIIAILIVYSLMRILSR